ncbi:hypothetical protein PFHG_02776 [Plasmodium falciparum HB3]|uniref:Uncharacterized protein n=4 Tax=Plasmodium falciparum TaxID=5833 RepID=A0A0L7KD12_PLAFX|nr:hypothetical protein PFHG_02776 [Plasmodium falciparum HB3]
MNSIKGSAKELFKHLKDEVILDRIEEKCNICMKVCVYFSFFINLIQQNNTYSYDEDSNIISSTHSNDEEYYEDIKYLKKEQLKAYICKLRKELRNYKMRELHLLSEIKYLKRKVTRLNDLIEHDNILLRGNRKGSNSLKYYDDNYSNKSYEQGGEISSCYMKTSEGKYLIKKNRFLYDSKNTIHNFHKKHRDFSINSINESINNCRRNRSMSNTLLYKQSKQQNKQQHQRQGGKGWGLELGREEDSSNMLHNITSKSVYSLKNINGYNNDNINTILYRNKYNSNNSTSSYYINNNNNNMKRYNSSTSLLCSNKNINLSRKSLISNTMHNNKTNNIFSSNRSLASFSKYELKQHLISNSKHKRDNLLTNKINHNITRDIQNYHKTRQRILSNNNISEKSTGTLLNKLSTLNNKNKHGQKILPKNNINIKCNIMNHKGNNNPNECPSNIITKPISNDKEKKKKKKKKKKKICYEDMFHFKHHQNILNKKYTSSYEYTKNKTKQNKENMINKNVKSISQKKENNIQSVEATQHNLQQIKNDAKIQNNNNMSDENNSFVLDPLVSDENKHQKEIKDVKPINDDVNKTSGRLNEQTNLQNVTSEKNMTYTSKSNHDSFISSENERVKEYLNKCRLKQKNKINTEQKNKINTEQKKSEKQPSLNTITKESRNSKLIGLKQHIDIEIKENFRKELDELKKRNNNIILKPSNFYNFPMDTSSSNTSDNSDNNICHKKENINDMKCTKYNVKTNPLKESTLLNISFNCIDKRITNLQNYLKNTKR